MKGVIVIDRKTIPIWEKAVLSVEDMMAYTGWGDIDFESLKKMSFLTMV